MSLDPTFPLLPPTVTATVPAPWPEESNFLLDPESRDEHKRQFSRDLLSVVQGNILQGHGRSRAVLVPFHVVEAGRRPPQFWQELERRITWAGTQRAAAQIAKLKRPDFQHFAQQKPEWSGKSYRDRKRGVFCGFALSARGMLALGAADDPAGKMAIDLGPVHRGRTSRFNAGMREIIRVHASMRDELPNWEAPFVNDIGGVWLLAGAYQDDLRQPLRELREFCVANGLKPCRPQWLTTWRNKRRQPREPFGFPDGLSMPAFFVPRPGRDKLGGRWVSMPLSQALIAPDVSTKHAGGSFLVLRKLEQDVAGFHRHMRDAGIDASTLVGRDRDGCPLAPFERGRGDWARLNNFDFDGDRSGGRCPFHAHIRKVNPREHPPADGEATENRTTVAVSEILRAQVVRRGMVYDPKHQLIAGERDPAKWPTTGTGLMFMAFMSDIERQFEVLQFDWMHNPDFPRSGAGTDALMAPAAGAPAFVKPLGGEYLYAPSRCWLQGQASGQ